MRVEFDRETCSGWFMCVDYWDAFEMNIGDGKADLVGSEEVDEAVFVREVPAGVEEDVEKSAEACPVNAIRVFEGDDQIYPE
jgi:ferredoxin